MRGRRRRRDRRGARRPRLRLPLGRHRRRRSRHGARNGDAGAGGILAREMLRAVRQVVGRVELAGMDVVEVSPPYDQSEITAMLAHRIVLEAISALAAKGS